VTQIDRRHHVTQGGPSDATNLLLYYIYQQAAQNDDTGLAAAATVMQRRGAVSLSLISFRLIERRGPFMRARRGLLAMVAASAGSADLGGAVRVDGGRLASARRAARYRLADPGRSVRLDNFALAWKSGNVPACGISTRC